jgi:hypothetical protein
MKAANCSSELKQRRAAVNRCRVLQATDVSQEAQHGLLLDRFFFLGEGIDAERPLIVNIVGHA